MKFPVYWVRDGLLADRRIRLKWRCWGGERRWRHRENMQLHTLSTQQVSVKLMSSQWKVPVSSLNWFENHTFFISQFYPLFLTRFSSLCCEIIEVPHAWTLRKLKDIRRNVSLDGVSGSLSIYPLCLLHYSFAKKKKKRKHQYPTVEELMSGCRALTHTHAVCWSPCHRHLKKHKEGDVNQRPCNGFPSSHHHQCVSVCLRC